MGHALLATDSNEENAKSSDSESEAGSVVRMRPPSSWCSSFHPQSSEHNLLGKGDAVLARIGSRRAQARLGVDPNDLAPAESAEARVARRYQMMAAARQVICRPGESRLQHHLVVGGRAFVS